MFEIIDWLNHTIDEHLWSANIQENPALNIWDTLIYTYDWLNCRKKWCTLIGVDVSLQIND